MLIGYVGIKLLRFKLYKRTLAIIGFISLLFMPVVAEGQISSGFQALQEFDFFKARKIFLKSIKKHPAAANYGLALIHCDSLNHFHSLDSAYFRLDAAANNWKILDSGKKLKYSAYAISDSTIQVLHDQICRRSFRKALRENTREGYDYFLRVYSGAPQKDEALRLRNTRAFEQALAENTSLAFDRFIRQYPEAAEVPEAMDRMDDAVFREETQDQRLEDYERFLKKYPGSKHVPEAENSIYSLAVPQESLEELYAFVKRYTTNRNTPAAWDLLYSRFTSDQRRESFTAFKERYPEYPYQERVRRDFELSGTRLFPVVRENKWGYCDSLGRVLIQYQFEEAGNFSENLAPVKIQGRSGYINKAGIRTISPRFSEAYPFRNGLAIVEMDSLSGLINTRGDWILKPDWRSIDGPYGNVYRLESANGIHFYHKGSDQILEEIFEESGEFSEGLCTVGKEGLWGYLDSTGLIRIALQFQEAQAFQSGYARVMQHGLYGLIDRNGKFILPCRYEGLGSISEGMVKVYQNGKCAYFDLKGKLKIPFKAECAMAEGGFDGFRNGLARFRRKGKTGFINASGKIVIEPLYEQVLDFSEGLAAFRKKGKWGYIDKNGKVVIQPVFDAVYSFSGGAARVGKTGRWGMIDRTGKALKPMEFESIQQIDLNYIFSGNGNKLLCDQNLTSIISGKYDEIRKSTESGLFELYKSGKFAYFHTGMNKIIWAEDGF